MALAGALPVPPRLGFYPLPLALAAAYGLLTALAFALWPLAGRGDIPGAALFRDDLLPDARRAARRRAGGGQRRRAVAALVALVVGTAERPLFALWFCLGALGTLGAVPGWRLRGCRPWPGGCRCGGVARACASGWPTCTARARRPR